MNLVKSIGGLVLVSVALYYLRAYLAGCVCDSAVRLDGKTALITGANSGIGLETAKDLAARGARVILTCRSITKCEEAREALIDDVPEAKSRVVTGTLDLGSIKAIKNFATEILNTEKYLHILINNAGVMGMPEYTETENAFESHFGVNHLGHFLLTQILLDRLKTSAPSRIILVSSLMHYRVTLNFTDLNLRNHYSWERAYSQSKLANVMYARELARRLKDSGVTPVSLHPGVVGTGIGRHLPWPLPHLQQLSQYFLFKTPKQGAQTTIHCAVDPSVVDHPGAYFSDCAPKEASTAALNDADARKLWDVSLRLLGL